MKFLNNSTGTFLLLIFMLTSGSVLNILGVNEIIQIVTFVLKLVISIKHRIITKIENVWALLKINAFLFSIFLLQALNYGDLTIILNSNNISFALIATQTALVCFYFRMNGGFIESLNKSLKLFVLYGIVSWVIITIIPPTTVLFKDADETTNYMGHLYLVFQRVNINYFGNLEPTYMKIFGLELYRAAGFSWESGNFSGYCNIFLFINLFFTQKRSNMYIAIIALLLSWSTMGIACMIIQLVLYVFINYKQLKSEIDKLLPKIIVGVTTIIILLGFFIKNFDEKIYGEQSGSGASRFINSYVSLKLISNNMFLGTGLYFANYSNQLENELFTAQRSLNGVVDGELVSNVQSTNSFFRIFAQFGLPIGLFFAFSLYYQELIPVYGKSFFLILLIIVSSAPLLYTPFFFMFIMSGILRILDPKE